MPSDLLEYDHYGEYVLVFEVITQNTIWMDKVTNAANKLILQSSNLQPFCYVMGTGYADIWNMNGVDITTAKKSQADHLLYRTTIRFADTTVIHFYTENVE